MKRIMLFVLLAIAVLSIATIALYFRVSELEKALDDLADLRDPNTHIGKFESLGKRVDKLERSSISQEFLSIVASCKGGKSNGPFEVPFVHPVLEIAGKVEEPLWLEVVVKQGDVGERHFLISYIHPTNYFKDVWDGYVSSIRGDVGYQVLSAKQKYLLRGWNHPYEEATPQFAWSELGFEIEIQIPNCGNQES